MLGTGRVRTVEQRDAARQVIIHEIQHAIQDIEKFAEGSDPETIKIRLIHRGKLSSEFRKIPDKKLPSEEKAKVFKKYKKIAGETETKLRKKIIT